MCVMNRYKVWPSGGVNDYDAMCPTPLKGLSVCLEQSMNSCTSTFLGVLLERESIAKGNLL